jgi:O-antigen/teichoic acid export membrane protein
LKDLKEKTIRGGFARFLAQAANFILRLVSLMVLARLLTPKDFGLVGMVTAFTGVLILFRDFGLSSAAIQRTTVTEEQLSTLFWINLLVGALLAVFSVIVAPFIAVFYHEPRLVAITDVLALGFLFNAAGVQHSAALQREMRFTALAVINTIGLIIGTAIAIGCARAGFGYWSLVLMTVTMPLISTLGFWLAAAWVPGPPRRRVGVRSMVQFGGTVTLNGVIAYLAANCDKILLGRFWGVDALGVYGRAYQLVNIPTDNLNQAAGEVAFSALSRIQDDPQRLKNYFLKGYSLVLAFTMPITVACALFAGDITHVLLGPKWGAAAPILRLLAPTILIFAVINPLFWLLSSLGLVKRSLKMSFVIAPAMVASYAIGLPHGPQGVAFAYSAGMMIWVLPLIAWAVHDTVVSIKEILLAVFRPLSASIVAAIVAFGACSLWGQMLPPLVRLILESAVLLVVFAGTLFFATGQKSLYLDVLRGIKGSSANPSIPTLENPEAS